MKLTRPLVSLDCESTGIRIESDRIISLAMEKTCPSENSHGCKPEVWASLFDPGFAMDPAVIAIHGIEDADLAGSPRFQDKAQEVLKFLEGSDILGFGLIHFDIPLIYEEFARAGITWNLDTVSIIDSGNLFKKKEERTLSAALKFYCGKEHVGAHGALADCRATREVLDGQLVRYPALECMTVQQLAEFSRMSDGIDLASKFTRGKDGEALYGFGDKRGMSVASDPGLARWLLGKDGFTQNTKAVARKLLAEIDAEREDLSKGFKLK
jgi:DNA polymerase III subunit epsilon